MTIFPIPPDLFPVSTNSWTWKALLVAWRVGAELLAHVITVSVVGHAYVRRQAALCQTARRLRSERDLNLGKAIL